MGDFFWILQVQSWDPAVVAGSLVSLGTGMLMGGARRSRVVLSPGRKGRGPLGQEPVIWTLCTVAFCM